MNKLKVIESIKEHEGLRLKPYKCTENKLTIGYGRNLEDRGITKDEAEFLLIKDVNKNLKDLKSYFNFDFFPDYVQEVLLEMSYQLGIDGLLKFKKTLKYIHYGDYLEASKEMLNSKWAKQTPKRAKKLSNIMKGGY